MTFGRAGSSPAFGTKFRINCSAKKVLVDMVVNKHYNSRLVFDAGWSSLVARRAHNPKAAGSNPAPTTKH